MIGGVTRLLVEDLDCYLVSFEHSTKTLSGSCTPTLAMFDEVKNEEPVAALRIVQRLLSPPGAAGMATILAAALPPARTAKNKIPNTE